MTVLERYTQLRTEVGARLGTDATLVWEYQELIYRIGVLETCQMFCKTAPQSTDRHTLFLHYQMVDGYIQALTNERRQGAAPNEETEKRRKTAQENLQRVVNDYRKRFGAYVAETPGQFKQDITNVINMFLPGWMQLRNTYINVPSKEENK